MSTPQTVLDAGTPVPLQTTPAPVDPELRAAFLISVERRRPQLERVAMTMMRCREDAEDIVQESLLKALRFLPRFRGDARIETWLHAIVVNTARDWLHLRRKRPQVSLETGSEELDGVIAIDLPQPGESPEESCCRHELLGLLQDEIRGLDPVHQMPIRLCDLDGRSYREAAALLKVTRPAMKARLFRARLLLKNRLAQHRRFPVSAHPETARGPDRDHIPRLPQPALPRRK